MELPGGWVSTPAPANLGLTAKWNAVKDVRLPDNLRAFSSDESHALTRQLTRWTKEPAGEDDWQSPLETLASGMGDCEDLALFERALLLNGLGERFDSKLWLLVVYDLAAKIDHALLWTPVRYVDCRAPKPLMHDVFTDYRPIAAFAGDEAVTFGKRRPSA